MSALVKPVTGLLGIVLLAVGIIGFFMNPILFFSTNTVHNIVHIASGIVGIVAANSGYGLSRGFLIVFGIVYAVVAILGWLNVPFVVDLLNVNMADNYLHAAIAVVSIVVGFGSTRNS